jgi:hypothetical protein
MDEEKIRDYDPTFTEQIIRTSNLDEQVRNKVKEQVLDEIIPFIPEDEDSIDQLIIKKIQLEEEIFPKLYNFRISSETYDTVYKDICERIQLFTFDSEKKITVIDNNITENVTIKTRAELDREKRLKYYKNK